MGGPCEPLTARQQSIAELEGYGFDLFDGVPCDWREVMTDDALAEAAKRAADEDPQYPDISELVDVIEHSLKALVAVTRLMAIDSLDIDKLAEFARQQADAVALVDATVTRIELILSQIAKAQEAADHDRA